MMMIIIINNRAGRGRRRVEWRTGTAPWRQGRATPRLPCRSSALAPDQLQTPLCLLLSPTQPAWPMHYDCTHSHCMISHLHQPAAAIAPTFPARNCFVVPHKWLVRSYSEHAKEYMASKNDTAQNTLVTGHVPLATIVQPCLPGVANVHAHLIHDYSGLPQPPSQTVAQSTLPFLHDQCRILQIRYTTPHMPQKKLSHPMTPI